MVYKCSKHEMDSTPTDIANRYVADLMCESCGEITQHISATDHDDRGDDTWNFAESVAESV